MKLRVYIVIIVFISCFGFSSFARYAIKKDLSYQILDSHSDYNIKSSGHQKEKHTLVYEILNTHGIENFKIFKLPYNKLSVNLDVHSITVTNKGKEVSVDLSKAQRTPASQSNDGLNSNFYYAIPIPNLQVNSKLKVVYTKQTKIPRNFFDNVFTYGMNILEQNSVVEISSQVPIHIKENDPSDSVLVETTELDGIYKVKIVQLKPLLTVPVNEYGAIMEYKDVHWVVLSSIDNWSKYSQIYYKKYEDRLKDELPKNLKLIKDNASKINGLEKQVDYILAEIAKKFNYIGDWRAIGSGYVPRSLKDIASSGYGDCKDFSISVIKILRELGYEAHTAFVKRGASGHSEYIDMTLPRSSAFNHAIVHIKDKGQSYWVDPTNPSSFGLSIRDDIADRKALVLWDKKDVIHSIPEINGKDNLISIDKNYDLFDDLNFAVNGKVKFTGSNKLLLSEIKKQGGDTLVNKFLVGIMRDIDTVNEIDFKGLDVDKYSFNKDVEASFSYKDVLTDSDKDGVPVSTKEAKPLTTLSKAFWSKHSFARYLGPKISFERNITINNAKLGEFNKSNCLIRSKWIDYESKINYKNNTLSLFESYTVKKNVISRADIKSEEHNKLNTEIDNCFFGDIAKFTSMNREIKKSDLVEVAKMNVDERLKYVKSKIAEKDGGGFKELELLMGIINDDPNNKEAFYHAAKINESFSVVRGPADVAKIRYADALISKAIKIDPDYTDAIVEKIWLTHRLTPKADMIPVAKQMIEKYPKDRNKFYALIGKIYKDKKDYQKSIDYFEKSIVDEVRYEKLYKAYSDIGINYVYLKKFELAREKLKQCLSLRPNYQRCAISMKYSYADEKDFENAIKWGKKAYEIKQNGYGVDAYTYAHIDYGAHLRREKKYELAITQYKKSLKIRQTGKAYLGLIKSLNKLKRYNEAYENLNLAFKNPEYTYYVNAFNKQMVDTLIALKKDKELLEFSQEMNPEENDPVYQTYLMATAAHYFAKNNQKEEISVFYKKMKMLFKVKEVKEDYESVNFILSVVYNYAFMSFDKAAIQYGNNVLGTLSKLSKSDAQKSLTQQYRDRFAMFTPERIEQEKQRRNIASVLGDGDNQNLNLVINIILHYKKEFSLICVLLLILVLHKRHKRIMAEKERRRKRRKKKRKALTKSTKDKIAS
ncbi:DUF3857 domain-containing protein [Halobacteriovorax sp. XZX-3]|uniref:DUF3857 domain-containing protein n=1 Tax=unclassified Halobacteriovorax TaxID=2639665 RepID=UPI00371B0076